MTCTAAIMQPYFLPYIGYFQLIAAVDVFVVYDDIEYTKRGWINRNRLLRDGAAVTFTLPLKNASDTLDIRERTLADDFRAEKLLNQFRGAYARAPHFEAVFALLESVLRCDDRNLFAFLQHSLQVVCRHLGIGTPLRISSTLGIDRAHHGEQRVLETCKALDARRYVNSIGGIELYSKERFAARGIELQFLKSTPFEYPQSNRPPVANLSIVDVLMFNDIATVRDRLRHGYELL